MNELIQPITFDVFQPFDSIAHGVFTRLGGVSESPFDSLNLSSYQADDPAAVAENQRRAYGMFGRTTSQLVHANLKHGNHVERVTTADHGALPECDGLITNDVGCGLTMNFADCGSIFLYDPKNHAIALGHAGWKGAIANVGGALVDGMVSQFGSDPADIIAALGPCISVSRYEVDEPVISEVHRAFPKWADRLLSYHVDDNGERVGRPHFNLALANHIGLYESGVKDVAMPTHCTASRTDLFFSHRAEKGKTGRFGAIFILNAAMR